MNHFGLIIVGDEILSGKRQDKHLAKVIELLEARGLALSWARYLGDDRPQLVAALRQSMASDDVVFCCGGIGATPDDHTRQAAAAALGVELVLHPEAARFIVERTAEMAREGKASADMTLPENLQRLKMAEFPAGAGIIPNPFNRIAGFTSGRHWFVPGFPVMAWPMIEWVLETHYADQFHLEQRGDRSMLVFEMAESTLTPLMEAVEREFDGIKVYSLPSVGSTAGQPADHSANGSSGSAMGRRHIELGAKGRLDQVDAAFERLLAGVQALGGEIG
jgi:molybdopterin-biosynthesis enzyme MoeA-like protein